MHFTVFNTAARNPPSVDFYLPLQPLPSSEGDLDQILSTNRVAGVPKGPNVRS
jgi:hypothetical protein